MEHMVFMERCLQLAKNGLGTTYPNPLVGSVIVHNGIIIGEGWHRKSGEAHAEVIAINSVSDKAKLAQSTLYVNLEPCSHFGKTPPCANLIIESKIPKVVIGNSDPNPMVAGNGIKKLLEAGIEVEAGILEFEGRELNKRFFIFHDRKRPFIILKWAQSADGFFAPQKHSGPHWISGKLSRQFVHKMRSEEQAILVGTHTVLADDPRLDVRDWSGNDPLKFAIDKNAIISSESNIFDKDGAVIFTQNSQQNAQNEVIDFARDVPEQIVKRLYDRNIQSVVIEGGANTLSHFIAEGLWDEAYVFTGANALTSGLKAPDISGKLVSKISIRKDQLIIYKR